MFCLTFDRFTFNLFHLISDISFSSNWQSVFWVAYRCLWQVKIIFGLSGRKVRLCTSKDGSSQLSDMKCS